MSTLNGQELEIFRAGNYGAKGTYTPEDLQQLASDYNPAQHEAPLVLGHPKTEDRAYGWCRKLRADGDKLFGTFEQVPEAIDQAVRDGAYKKRSVAITRKPDGKLSIRHVGLLGAMVPGITGMADAKFSEEAFDEFEFSSAPGEIGMADQQVSEKTITESIRAVFADMFGNKDKGTQAVDVEALEKRLEAKFAAAADEKVKTLQTEFSDYKAKHEKAVQAGTAKEAIAKLKAEKKWLPAFDRMGVPELFAAVAEGSTEEFEFADSDKTKKKLDPLTALTAIIGGVAKIVPRGHVFGDEVVAAVTPTAPEVPEGTAVDPASVRFNEEVLARAKEKSIPYGAALSQLTAEGKSSASYVNTAAGSV